MVKDRALRRAHREAVAAQERTRRANEVMRRDRARRRRDAIRRLFPKRPRVAPGLLARRRRRRMAAGLGIVVVVCAVTWPLLPGWGARLFVLAGLLMAAPIVWVMSFGRV